MKRNTKAMEEYNHKRGTDTRERVLNAIDKCKKEGEISVTIVCKIAGISRTYFTNHPDMRKVLDNAIGSVNRNLKKRKQNQDSKDVLNKTLYAENIQLKKKIKELEKDETYKDKYDEKCSEIENLKLKLEEANRQSGLLDF